MSGLSALSFAGAKAITTQKVDAAEAQNAKARADGKPTTAKTKLDGVQNLFGDLFRNDLGELDIGDFQMILISLVAVVTYWLQSYAFLGQLEISQHVTMPDVDTTMLAGFGIGQGAYLAKKAASNPGEG